MSEHTVVVGQKYLHGAGGQADRRTGGRANTATRYVLRSRLLELTLFRTVRLSA